MFQTIRLKILIRICIFVGLGATVTQARAGDQLIDEYVALFSVEDHWGSDGARHKTIAGVIRQDRLNFHSGKGDSLDETDKFFAVEANRKLIPAILANRPVDAENADIIMNDRTAIVIVSIFRTPEGQEYFEIVAI